MSDTPRTDELRLRGHDEAMLLEYEALERELAELRAYAGALSETNAALLTDLAAPANSRGGNMKDSHYRALLDLMMCSDPFPQSVNREEVVALVDDEARERGFDNWIDSYHQFNPNPPHNQGNGK